MTRLVEFTSEEGREPGLGHPPTPTLPPAAMRPRRPPSPGQRQGIYCRQLVKLANNQEGERKLSFFWVYYC